MGVPPGVGTLPTEASLVPVNEFVSGVITRSASVCVEGRRANNEWQVCFHKLVDRNNINVTQFGSILGTAYISGRTH